MKNQNISLLDVGQIVNQQHDEAHDAQRVILINEVKVPKLITSLLSIQVLISLLILLTRH